MRTLLLCLVIATGCMMPPTGAALIQQTAQEFNFDTRFGRMEMAVEQVSPKYLERFQKRHRYWGGVIHVTDAEMMGMKMKGQEDCDVDVRVGWYRVNEGDLRTTIVRQRWHRFTAGWRLDGEERADGDVGALGEAVDVIEPDAPTKSAQFPTVQLGSD
ncbi:MAG TPA: hypothetical protein VLM85_08080 [Polyangiaceae bacterium]|nr:hypothetical protein [Polyangiaceae bacterium]